MQWDTKFPADVANILFESFHKVQVIALLQWLSSGAHAPAELLANIMTAISFVG